MSAFFPPPGIVRRTRPYCHYDTAILVKFKRRFSFSRVEYVGVKGACLLRFGEALDVDVHHGISLQEVLYRATALVEGVLRYLSKSRGVAFIWRGVMSAVCPSPKFVGKKSGVVRLHLSRAERAVCSSEI